MKEDDVKQALYSMISTITGGIITFKKAVAAEAFWGRDDDEPVEQRSPSPRVLRRRNANSRAPPARVSLSAHLPADVEQSLRRCGILAVAMPKPASRTAWKSLAQKLR
eukprot:m51a1_g1507 hypothetical protein (108) ;mRNA; f:390706-392344